MKRPHSKWVGGQSPKRFKEGAGGAKPFACREGPGWWRWCCFVSSNSRFALGYYFTWIVLSPSPTCKTAHCRDGLGEAPKSRFAPGPRGPRGLWAPWPRCARMTQVEIENIKTYTRGHKKIAMVLCLKIINLGPTQEKIKKKSRWSGA